MYKINKEHYVVPTDIFNIINNYQMVSITEIKEIYEDVIVEIKLFNYLKGLKLDKSQIRNQIRVLNFIKNRLMEDLYLVYEETDSD